MGESCYIFFFFRSMMMTFGLSAYVTLLVREGCARPQQSHHGN